MRRRTTFMRMIFAALVAGAMWASLPVMAATIAFEVGTSLNKLRKGQLTPMECIDEIRNKSIPLAGSIIGASVGQAAIPVPIPTNTTKTVPGLTEAALQLAVRYPSGPQRSVFIPSG